MTMMAHGTNPAYANAYWSWWDQGGRRGGQPRPNPQDYGMPSSSGPTQPLFNNNRGNAFNPGRAQPMQTPSYGTPYGGRQRGGGGFEAYSPQGSGRRADSGSRPQQSGERGFGGRPDGNLAYASPENRPPPFEASYGQIDGSFSSRPNFAQRDAMIAGINNQLGQMQQQSWANPGSVGAPQFNFGQMWDRAGQMAQRGYQNPLAGLFGG